MPATAELPTWDLSDLYDRVDDPRLESDLTASLEEACRFEQTYRGTIAQTGLTAGRLKQALDEYEALLRAESRPQAYAQLHFSTDTADPARGALIQKTREIGSEISTHLLFFDLELGRIPEDTFQGIIGSPELGEYRHYLEHQRKLAAHFLSEPEEKILEETANSRGRAFRRLFTEVTSRMKFRLEHDGETKDLNQSQLLSLLYEPDRSLRQAAAQALGRGLEQNSHVLCFIHNTLLHEKLVMDRLRGFESPEADRHLDNELSQQVVDTMASVCAANFDCVAEYYELKRRLLGLDQLHHYDRYAPLSDEREELSFPQAQKIVLEAFSSFSARLAELAEPFFQKRWIDAVVKDGKRGGAFCAGVTPDHHPYVLLNYTGKPRDVMTLAHELGHGVHDRLASRQNLLNYHPALPVAETASTFGELLVFERLQQDLQTDAARLALLCEKLEDTFATVFRQISMYRFEQRLHKARREQGELPVESINALWQESMQEMFGHSLTLGPDHRWTWLYIPHIVNTPFYVYAYAFGELLVLSLYARYKAEGAPFIQKYFELLATGGSTSPSEMLARLDIDISQRSFWQGGCDLIR
ncbi:MAG: M3 family oligoendopeptidase, partial [Candidatus Eremiobacterota bacterium]